ncbi:MAG: hypothetical protein EAY66_05345 [Sphingobacteriales bacterium]|nr:MAG: hypothetical protein EAY66_05345 [Sphingobacteriales bacterium]
MNGKFTIKNTKSKTLKFIWLLHKIKTLQFAIAPPCLVCNRTLFFEVWCASKHGTFFLCEAKKIDNCGKKPIRFLRIKLNKKFSATLSLYLKLTMF